MITTETTRSATGRRWAALLVLPVALSVAFVACGGGGQTSKPEAKVTGCNPITVAAFHEVTPAGMHPFLANQRLALIENGRVPCVDVETAEATDCPFDGGNWLEDAEGRRFAQVGQPVSKDGTPVGDHVIAARQEAGRAPCVGATGHDTAGYVPEGEELMETCVIQVLLKRWNSYREDEGYPPLFNFAHVPVCSNDDPEVDPSLDIYAHLVSADRNAKVWCYDGTGAGLNDVNGIERNANGDYLVDRHYCHYLESGGLLVPAAKRPATRSLPAPGAVNPNSSKVWRPVNPLIYIANVGEHGRDLPREWLAGVSQQPLDATVIEGDSATFSVVATGIQPIYYGWTRNGVDIPGAPGSSYTTPPARLTDNGAKFRVSVANFWGAPSFSTTVTLTVIPAVKVLTLTQQPSGTSVEVGAQATFGVAATCDEGTLAVQWQRGQGAAGAVAWTDVPGATATTYGLRAAIGDNGAHFRARLDCSGQGATFSEAATLTVIAPGTVALSALPITGLRDSAAIPQMTGIDQAPDGSFTFITRSRIKRLSADHTTITPVAGGADGAADGPAAAASFNQPLGLTQDTAGNVYVADTGNHTLRRIAVDGTVTTLAGMPGVSGTDDGAGGNARFSAPRGIDVGPDGDLYVVDSNNHRVRRVTSAGFVTTYAGSVAGYMEGAPLSARFNSPTGVAVAANGDVLVADTSNARIRRIVREGGGAGRVDTLAGNGTGTPASPDGVGTAAVIVNPRGLVVRGNTLTVRDTYGLLRQIDLTTATVTTLTGSRGLGDGYADGTATTARIRGIGLGLTVAPNGGFMLVDDVALRHVSASGDVTTLAAAGAVGATPEGVGTLAQMPFGGDLLAVTVDPTGGVVIADRVARQVRRVSPAGAVSLVAGLVGSFGTVVDGIGSAAQFGGLGDAITSDAAGVLYVGDNNAVRRIGTDNRVTLLAGSPTDFGALDGGPATARFNRVRGLAVGPGGDVFASDSNHAIRRITPEGTVSTYAGVLGQPGQTDGPIATARFMDTGQMAFGPDGALYVVERTVTGRLRRIAPDGASVSTVATGLTGSAAIDAEGTLFYWRENVGLTMLPPGGQASVLIRPGAAIVLGSDPRLPAVDALAVLGPKHLMILSGRQMLKVTRP